MTSCERNSVPGLASYASSDAITAGAQVVPKPLLAEVPPLNRWWLEAKFVQNSIGGGVAIIPWPPKLLVVDVLPAVIHDPVLIQFSLPSESGTLLHERIAVLRARPSIR
jgi:hypothetical protein